MKNRANLLTINPLHSSMFEKLFIIISQSREYLRLHRVFEGIYSMFFKYKNTDTIE
ncbi:hypothetical protein ES708_11632 [subsurface metagenome]